MLRNQSVADTGYPGDFLMSDLRAVPYNHAHPASRTNLPASMEWNDFLLAITSITSWVLSVMDVVEIK